MTRPGAAPTLVGVVAALLIAAAWWATATPTSATDRTVRIDTTACGDASATNGVGVIVGEGLVLTVAHTVIGAGDVVVTLPDGDVVGSATVRLDPRTDLALVSVPGAEATPIELVDLVAGDSAEIVVLVGAPIPATVVSRAEVRIEEVRSEVRSSRFSYVVDVRVALGDSGAGVFDGDARLAGIVYGRSEVEADRSFAVRREEIDLILSAPDHRWSCDPTQHRVVAA